MLPSPASLPFGTTLPPAESFTNGTYLSLVRLTGARVVDCYHYTATNGIGQMFGGFISGFTSLLHHNSDYRTDLRLALLGAVALTLFRLLLNQQLIPALLRHKFLAPKDGDRFAESFYTHLFYTCSFTMSAIIEHQTGFLANPERLWIGFSIIEPVPTLVWYLYILQISHYLHCLYAIAFLNRWSKDSAMLFFHHIVALQLLSLSYLNRTYRLGIMVMYLHDISDVIMEGCKCLIKLQFSGQWSVKLADLARVVGFGLFVFFWFVFRLYFFPLNVIYPAVLYLSANPIETWFPLCSLLYFLLWFIFSMNVYWASLIVKVLINALRGDIHEIEDIREVDEEVPKSTSTTTTQTTITTVTSTPIHSNGVHKQANGHSKKVD